jgi:hypothetical protein
MIRSVMPWRECCSCKFGSKTTGLQLLSHNPVSHPSSLGTVKCDVYQAEATGIGYARETWWHCRSSPSCIRSDCFTADKDQELGGMRQLLEARAFLESFGLKLLPEHKKPAFA